MIDLIELGAFLSIAKDAVISRGTRGPYWNRIDDLLVIYFYHNDESWPDDIKSEFYFTPEQLADTTWYEWSSAVEAIVQQYAY